MGLISGYARTDKGKVRLKNEDSFCVDRYFKPMKADKDTLVIKKKPEVLAGVFDGMGGEENGEMAAFIASKTMARFDGHVPDGNWEIALQEMNRRINDYARDNNARSMGSTAAIVSISQDTAEICNLGDSRIYLCSGGRLRQLSKDHTEWQRALDMNLPDMNLVGSGIPKNQLTRYLGIRSHELNPYVVPDIRLQDGDVLLLCSDGLTGMVEEKEIEAILGGRDSKAMADSLVETALAKGGKDNVTVMVLCYEEKTSWFQRLFR